MTKTGTESSFLGQRFRLLQRGAKIGFKGGARAARAKIRGMVRRKKATVSAIKQAIVDYANAHLMPETRGKLLGTVKNAKTFKNLEKAEAMIERVREQSDRRDLLRDIKDELSEKFYTGHGDQRKSKYSPYVTKTLESFHENLSFKDPAGLKYRQLEITQRWITDHPSELMSDDILESLDELQRTHLKLLTNAELKEQLKSIKILKTQGKTFKRLTVGRMKEERAAIIQDFTGRITGGKGIDLTKPIVGREPGPIEKSIKEIKGFLTIRQLIPDVLFDILDEKTKGALYSGKIHNLFIGRINAARDVELKGVNKMLGEAHELLNRLRIYQRAGDKTDFGDGVELTRNQMLDVYVKSHDKAILQSLIEGNRLTERKLNTIISALTPEEKEFGDWLIQSYGVSYAGINDVFRKVHFYDMPKNEGYSPMTKDLDYVGEEDINLVRQQLEYAKASVPKGFTKERVGSLAPVRLDAIGNFVDFVVRSEHYKAFELAIREMSAILSGIKPAVYQEYGKEYYQLLRQYIQDVANNGKYEISYLANFMLKARRQLSFGLLGLNLVTSAKHITASLGGAMSEIKPQDFIHGLYEYYSNKKKWDAFWDRVPQIAERAKSMSREMEEIAQTKTPIGRLMGRKGIAGLQESQMYFLRVGDKNIVRGEATAVYLSARSQGKSEKEAIEAAVSKMRRTQTGGDIKDLPALMRGGVLEKMFTMFMSERNKYYNLLYSNIRAYRHGRIPFRKLAQALFWAWIFPGLALEEIRKGGTASPAELLEGTLLGPFENILVFGNVLEAIRNGYPYDTGPVFSLLHDVVKEAQRLVKGDVGKGVIGLAETAASAAGISARPATRSISGLSDLLSGKTSDWRRLIWSPAALGERQKGAESPGGLLLPALPMLESLPSASNLPGLFPLKKI